MRNSTTDIEKVRVNPEQFAWGKIIELHEVGPYVIAECYPWKVARWENGAGGGSVRVGEIDPNALEFHGWVDGQNTSHSWGSLDAALVGCIAYKHEGPNHHADYYFMKMIWEKELTE